jgi:Spy/CpxP family protein refolding chaperone
MKIRTILALFAAACISAGALAQQAAADDPFAEYFYPPERVMANALEIGLDDAQKSAIKSEVQKVQGKFLDLQFEMQGESEKLVRLLKERPVDETKVLGEVDRILALEKEIKRTQVSLLVRIRNLLTPAQQDKLTQLQKTASK